jgi:hypothetical protein
MPSSLARISGREESAGFERREGGTGRGTRPTLPFGLTPAAGTMPFGAPGKHASSGQPFGFYRGCRKQRD